MFYRKLRRNTETALPKNKSCYRCKSYCTRHNVVVSVRIAHASRRLRRRFVLRGTEQSGGITTKSLGGEHSKLSLFGNALKVFPSWGGTCGSVEKKAQRCAFALRRSGRKRNAALLRGDVREESATPRFCAETFGKKAQRCAFVRRRSGRKRNVAPSCGSVRKNRRRKFSRKNVQRRISTWRSRTMGSKMDATI
jgi:hypothetical protein